MAKQPRTFERWSAEQARAMLAEAERSGLSDRAFAASRGIDAQRLRWWRTRFETSASESAQPESKSKSKPKPKAKARAKAVPVKFAEVVPRRSLSSNAGVAVLIEIELANGRRVRVPTTIDGAVLRRLLETIEARRC